MNDAVHKIEDDKFANAPPWGVAYRAAANKYYPTLHEAFEEAVTGTDVDHPDVITVLKDIDMLLLDADTGGTEVNLIKSILNNSGGAQHIKLTVPANKDKKLYFAQSTTNAMFTLHG